MWCTTCLVRLSQMYLYRMCVCPHRVGHNEIIGVMRVGCHAEGLGRDHWNEMLAYPRKPIAHWHPLLESKKSEKEVGLGPEPVSLSWMMEGGALLVLWSRVKVWGSGEGRCSWNIWSSSQDCQWSEQQQQKWKNLTKWSVWSQILSKVGVKWSF